jgi:hypothetical protein
VKQKREKLPPHMAKQMTLRQFKAIKRRQAKIAERALKNLLGGAAYMPRVDGFYIGRLVDDLRRARKEWQKWWAKA